MNLHTSHVVVAPLSNIFFQPLYTASLNEIIRQRDLELGFRRRSSASASAPFLVKIKIGNALKLFYKLFLIWLVHVCS